MKRTRTTTIPGICILTLLLLVWPATGQDVPPPPQVVPGDTVKVVIVEKTREYDADRNTTREVERLISHVGKLLAITENAYRVQGKNEKEPWSFPIIRVQSIVRIDTGATPSNPDTESSAPGIAPPATPLADATRPMQDQIRAGHYREAADSVAQTLTDADASQWPMLARTLASALDGWLGEVEYETTRVLKVEDCTRIESRLAEIVGFLYQETIKRLPPDMLDRTGFLSRVMNLWAESYMRRIGFMRSQRPEPGADFAALATAKKKQITDLLDNLRQSIYYTESLPENPRVLWAQAEIHAYQGEKGRAGELATRALELARDGSSAQTGRNLVSQIDQFLRNLPTLATIDMETESARAAAIPPTPVPVAQPVARSAAQPAVQSEAAPASNSKIDQTLEKLRPYWLQFGQPAVDIVRANPVPSGAIAGFIVVFWIVPMLLMKAHTAGGDLRASMFRKRVRYLGLIGYVTYRLSSQRGGPVAGAPPIKKENWLSKLFKRRKKTADDTMSHMTCASCANPIDRVEDYALSLKFDACPHCGIAIEPVIEFEEFVRHLIERATQQAEHTRNMKNQKKRMKAEEMGAQTMARMLNGMYSLAVRRRATDIHLQRDQQCGKITYRVDGMLSKPIDVPLITAPHFLSAVKIQAGLDITNHTTPQDGRINIKIEGVGFDIRVNCAPTPEGEVIFLRLLDKRNITISARQLGFQGKNLEAFEDAIRRPHGLILVTGPTGSGKSTTLYVALNEINTGERNILTIEDPVEYRIDGLKQMQVNPEKNFTFATGLRSVLRQDPDVIMVGEIRDHETANMAVEAAMTGHLVFSTLHTMDTASAVSRLADLGVAAPRYASALTLIVAQRLIRLICDNCKQQHLPTDAELQRVGLLSYKTKIKFMAGKGCHTCNFSGYYGRRAVLEMLNPDDRMRSLMEKECRPHVLRDFARQSGMRLLREEAALKIIAGESTVEEVIRVTA